MVVNGKYTHGGDVYSREVSLDFSANVNPFGTPEKVVSAIAEAARGLSAYPDPYCAPLRQKLAATLGVSPQNIVCGNGAAELIYQFAAALRPSLDAFPERTANAVTDALSEQLNDISEKLDGVANNAPVHITKEVKVQEDTWGITTKKLPYLFGGGIVGAGIAAAIILLGGDSN